MENNYYEPGPQNYVKYEPGDNKVFGDIKKDDFLYLYDYLEGDILEIVTNGPLSIRGSEIYIRTKTTKRGSSKIVIGPVNGISIGKQGNYHPDKVSSSSICIAFSGGWIVGTNKETVRKYAKLDISNFIKKIENEIKSLQNTTNSLTKRLKSI